MKKIIALLTLVSVTSFGVYISVSPDGTVNQGITSASRVIYPLLSGFIPSGMVQWLTGNNGSNATAVVGVDAPVVDVNCLSFDGVVDYVDTGIIPDVETEWEVYMDFDETSVTHLYGSFANGALIQFGLVSGSWNAYFGNKSSIGLAPFNGLHTFKINKTGFYVDGVIQDGGWTAIFTATSDQNIFLGGRSLGGALSSPTKSVVYESILRNSGVVLQHLTFEEGSGLTTYDVSGNGNHGTISGATWTTDDGIASYNAEYGHARWQSGSTNLYVPRLLDLSGYATNSVVGFTLDAEYEGGITHNLGEYSLVTYDGATNSASDFAQWNGYTNGPWQNILTYTNTPEDVDALNAWCLENGGIWTNFP